MEVRITSPLEDLTVAENAADSTIDLFERFDDPFTTGLVASFELFDPSIGNGVTNVVLFDQEGEGAPISVENFLNYIEDGDYINSIIHRSIPGFVIQGGGFTVDGLEQVVNPTGNGAAAVELVPTDDPIENEFSPERSNVRGTIAFAQLSGDPDSATSQWFFNLSDNSENLDNQNGGFTVFGQVLGEEDLATIDAIAALPILDATAFFAQPAFTDLPLNTEFPNPTTANIERDQDLVRYRNITVSEVDELTFAVVDNSNPELVEATISDDGELILDYQDGESGNAEITVSATNLLGDTVEETFAITVEEDNDDSEGEEPAAPTVDDVSVTLAENSAVGTVVATLDASDPNGDELTFAITSGNVDRDEDNIPAFIISDNGMVMVADPDELDFETIPTFQLGVTASDPGGLSDTATVTIDLEEIDEIVNLVPVDDTLLSIIGESGEPLNLSFSVSQVNSDQVNEIGTVRFDDSNGTVNGLSPGDSGYLQAALSNSEIIFSVLPNQGDEVLELPNVTRSIQADSDDLLAFYLIDNGTTDAVLSGETPFQNVRLGGLEAGVLEIESLSEESFSLNFLGGALTVQATATEEPLPVGTDLQGAPERELIDLSDIDGNATVTLGGDGVQAIADFDNLVGLYRVDNADGTVDGLTPGDEGYAAAALARAVDDFLLRGGSEGNTTAEELGSVSLSGNGIYAPFIIVNGGNGSVEDFLDDNPNNTVGDDPSDPVAYFPYIAANPDGVDHLRLLGDNTFGFEDLPGGGDRDFNDFVFEVLIA